MQIFMDNTPHSTKRFWLFRLNDLTEAELKRLESVKQMLTTVSCWGGADKVDRDSENRIETVSFEIPFEIGDSVWTITKHLIEKAGVSYSEGFPQ